MPTTRRRPEQEFEATKQQLGTETLTISGLTGGYNGYTNPELLSPQFWASPSANVYSGLHGAVRRARWAPLLNSTTSGYAATSVRMTSMFGVYFPTQNPWLFFDTNGQIWWLNGLSGTPVAKIATQTNTAGAFYANYYLPAWNLAGPFMRVGVNAAMVLEANGLARTKIFLQNNVPILELLGIDAPDSSPQIVLSAGASITLGNPAAARGSNFATVTATAGPLPVLFATGNFANVTVTGDTSFNTPAGQSSLIRNVLFSAFDYQNTGPDIGSSGTGGSATVQITKTTGRSYQWAWENANTGHVSAPSPASQYVAYNNQVGTINCVQPGTVAHSIGSSLITGTATSFSQAWVGRSLYLGDGSGPGQSGNVQQNMIVSVADSTHLTINGTSPSNGSGVQFQVYDQQATHLRLYGTGDGGTTYLRIARNALASPLTVTLATSGLQFVDTANAEPPNAPFTNEFAQTQNVPPPIGKFLDLYQGRPIVYGVPAAPASFFYGNIEATVVGQPPESFAPLNQVTLPIGDGQLNGTANLPTGFILWSNRQEMFKLTGQLTDNTIANPQQLGASIQRLPYKIGSASPYGTAVASLGAFWFSSDREFWLFTDHYAPKNVGKPIQDLLNLATRINFARVKNYKSGDRNWIALAITTKGGAFNDTLCLLDLDLLASNGQPSFFTFDMATNQPSWYVYNVNCESIEAAFDAISTNHLLAGDVDLITDLDWQPAYYTVSAEQSIPVPQLTLHAIGNEAPELIKTGRWMRVTTNQLPKNLASQGWNWNILCYDDDKFVLGVQANPVSLVPGVDSPNQVFALEYSPAVFRFGGLNPVKGRRFQIQTNFPSGPGFYELRGFQISYDSIVAR
jgi:hypothetical protein